MVFGCCGGGGDGGSRTEDGANQETAQPVPMTEVIQPNAVVCADDGQPITIASSTLDMKGVRVKREKVIWDASTPMSKADVDRKRIEFWETVAEFGGKVEVWNALKAAIEAVERDLELAQAILECAGISLPAGSLQESYDESGFRYVVPNYCLSYPKNLSKQTGPVQPSQHGPRSKSFSQVPQQHRKIAVRMDDGQDVAVEWLPTISTIGDLECSLKRSDSLKMNEKDRLLFFSKGSGPLKRDTSLDELLPTMEGPLQAWKSSKHQPS